MANPPPLPLAAGGRAVVPGPMLLTCPSCAATYDVPDGSIGPDGRQVRCRACDTRWREPGRPRPAPPIGSPAVPPAEVAPAVQPEPSVVLSATPAQAVVRRRRAWRRVPWLLLGLGGAVVGLGAVASVVAFGSDRVASHLGLAERRSPLGISIDRSPDWRLIAGGSQLFAVSGRVWNPTAERQPVPDIHAELKNRQGRVVYGWTIARPVAALAPGAVATFDGAAVDVPASSTTVIVTLAGVDAP